MGLERTPCEFEIIPRPVEPGIRVYCKRCQVRVGSWKLPVGAELVFIG